MKTKALISFAVAKTKALISFAVTAKLICVFVFAYADCWFSHEAAHLFDLSLGKLVFKVSKQVRHKLGHASTQDE